MFAVVATVVVVILFVTVVGIVAVAVVLTVTAVVVVVAIVVVVLVINVVVARRTIEVDVGNWQLEIDNLFFFSNPAAEGLRAETGDETGFDHWPQTGSFYRHPSCGSSCCCISCGSPIMTVTEMVLPKLVSCLRRRSWSDE